ncbi:hypothetical protein [Hymenobacter terrigena]
MQHPWRHSAMLWLLSNVIGTLLLGLRLFAKGESNFAWIVIISLFAAGISLPTIPLSVPIFKRVLQFPSKQGRICLAFLSVTGLFTVAVGFVVYINQEFNLSTPTIVELLLPFYLGAIIATGLEYQKWLFRVDG